MRLPRLLNLLPPPPSQPDPPPGGAPDPELAPVPESEGRTAQLLQRLGWLFRAVETLLRKVRLLALLSALSALWLWALLFSRLLWPPSWELLAVAPVLVLGALLVPAGITYLAVTALRDLLSLPARIAALPAEVRERLEEVLLLPGAGAGGGGRMLGGLRALLRIRAFLRGARGTLFRMVSLAKGARLLSLPFFLVLLVALALDFALVIVGGILAVLALLFRG